MVAFAPVPKKFREGDMPDFFYLGMPGIVMPKLDLGQPQAGGVIQGELEHVDNAHMHLPDGAEIKIDVPVEGPVSITGSFTTSMPMTDAMAALFHQVGAGAPKPPLPGVFREHAVAKAYVAVIQELGRAKAHIVFDAPFWMQIGNEAVEYPKGCSPLTELCTAMKTFLWEARHHDLETIAVMLPMWVYCDQHAPGDAAAMGFYFDRVLGNIHIKKGTREEFEAMRGGGT